jgi:hypothetical protein
MRSARGKRVIDGLRDRGIVTRWRVGWSAAMCRPRQDPGWYQWFAGPDGYFGGSGTPNPSQEAPLTQGHQPMSLPGFRGREDWSESLNADHSGGAFFKGSRLAVRQPKRLTQVVTRLFIKSAREISGHLAFSLKTQAAERNFIGDPLALAETSLP